MSKYYKIEEKSISPGAMAEYVLDIPAGHMLEDLMVCETGGATLYNTKLELQIDDLHYFGPYVSLSTLGQNAHEALKIEERKQLKMEVKGKIYNDTTATITVRLIFGIRT